MHYMAKDRRQAIYSDHTARHDGNFDPKVFFEEVWKTGKKHGAYQCFEWDRKVGWLEYNYGLARKFSEGLVFTQHTEVVTHDNVVIVREESMPFALSPIAGRAHGGGYFITDPNNPEHMAEYDRQAERDLAAWLKRYRSSAVRIGGIGLPIEQLLDLYQTTNSAVKQEAA
jgi:hypothetical protein